MEVRLPSGRQGWASAAGHLDQMCWQCICVLRLPLNANCCSLARLADPWISPLPLPQPPALPFGSCLATSCATPAARSGS